MTDPEVQKNLITGNLSKKWSIFAGYQDKMNDMLQGTKALSVTLVRNPAYPNASFRVGATQEELDEKGHADLDDYYRTMKGNITRKQPQGTPADRLAESLYRLEHMSKNSSV